MSRTRGYNRIANILIVYLCFCFNVIAEKTTEMSAFEKEMSLAKDYETTAVVSNRDYSKAIQHLKQAKIHRPDNKRNVELDHQMTVLLLVRPWPESSNREEREQKAFEIYQQILTKYQFSDYYSTQSIASANIGRIMPEAALYCAGHYRRKKDYTKTLDYYGLCFAMFEEIRDERAFALINKPKPVRVRYAWEGTRPYPMKKDPDAEHAAWVKIWEEDREKAAVGDVLARQEIDFLQGAYRSFIKFYQTYDPAGVEAQKEQLKQRFPGILDDVTEFRE